LKQQSEDAKAEAVLRGCHPICAQNQSSFLPSTTQYTASGADVLFEDPERRSTSVGVTVSPVRVANIGQFGDLTAVGQRLLEAEQKKVGSGHRGFGWFRGLCVGGWAEGRGGRAVGRAVAVWAQGLWGCYISPRSLVGASRGFQACLTPCRDYIAATLW